GPISPSRHLCRPHPQGRETRRPAGPAGDQVRVRYQPTNGQGARHHHPANAARPRRRGDRMIRPREFITFFGSAAAWPLASRAQQGDRVRRIGVLMPSDENDPGGKPYVSAFIQALAGLGWTDGRNVRMDLRWYGDDNNRIRALAQELVGLQPDIILATTTPA